MSANYKNWVPNGMITALTAGTAVLGVGTAALMCVNMNPNLKKALVGTAGAGTLLCGAMTAWSIYAHGKFSYDGNRQLSKEIVEGTAKYVTLPEGGIGLDVGCGSGILAIVALMYGAKHAKGTDLDPCALDATKENMAKNGISEEDFEMIIGNIITEKSVQDWAGYNCYDIVVANILHTVLEPLTPVVVNQIKPGGIYITSGIIAEKEDFSRKTVFSSKKLLTSSL